MDPAHTTILVSESLVVTPQYVTGRVSDRVLDSSRVALSSKQILIGGRLMVAASKRSLFLVV